MRIERELYGASAAVLVERLAWRSECARIRDLIDHNAALQLLALDLARPAPGVELGAEYSTAGLATLAIPGPSGRALDPGTAELVGFVRPRDLEG